ncbi:aminotransferase class I and II [Blastococcus sp. BMG 814]|uniref:Aminotransferase class I and II n=1 Tax=Blastococcus carthaginiensis TaxID=3050034 RepID=A0ABT9IFL7_9ACTN|nr:HipA family kinase [Blastococcus carthaginiensis]MDP5183987.1 aminotransferase class I and II [Blastococcus carthaginiensis]
MLPSVTATRYVTPLREGGSLPGLMEADDLGTYVVKWRGAGQGVKVLVAEVVCAELARALGLPVPALVTVDVVPELAVGEPDHEVQELLQRSAGRNLGLDYLPGALDFEAGADGVDPELAGRVLWFDALIGNVDRSWRNPNMLFWHGRLQLIDHGAALTFHHHWPGAAAAVERAYDASAHALVECTPDVAAADAALAPRITRDLLDRVLAQVPDEWLDDPAAGAAPDAVRGRYADQLLARLGARTAWLPGVVAAAAAGGAGRRRPPRGENRPAWLGPPPPEGISQR